MKSKIIHTMEYVKLVHDAYLAVPNGANTVMNSLLKNGDLFKKYGIELSSLSPDNFNPINYDKDAIKSLNIKGIGKKILVSLSQRSRIAAALLIYLTWMRRAKKMANFYIKSDHSKNEVVFFHTLLPCYYYLKSRRYYQHTVLVLHTNGDNYKMGRIYYKALEKSYIYKKLLVMEEFTLTHVDRISFVSEMSRDNFLSLHPNIDQKKVFFIYNGVPDITIHSCRDNDCLEFCCVASLTRRKGQQYIIDALKMFGDKRKPKIHFTFVGDGDDRADMERDVKESKLSSYITFAGMTNDVNSYLSKSSVFILPSDDEGLPMAIIEAMRASLPIVSTPVGGIPEMICDKKNGLIIQPNAESIFKLLETVELYDWEKMGKEARKTYEEKFSLNQMIDGYVKLLSFTNKI